MGRELLPESTRAGLNAARVRGRLKRKMTEQKLLSAKKLLAALVHHTKKWPAIFSEPPLAVSPSPLK